MTGRSSRVAPAAFVSLAVLVVLSGARGARAMAGPFAASDAAAQLQSAQRQFNLGNYSSAITTLQAAVSQNPNNSEVYFWLGRSYYELHDFNSAISQLEKSIQLDGKNSVYHQWLGRAYGDKADHDKSLSAAKKVKKAFEDAVHVDPSNVSARRDLEEYLIDAPWIAGGSKDDAKAQVEAIAQLDPVQGHIARGVFYANAMKKPDLAELEFREVVKAKTNKIEAYFDAADFFAHQNKPADIDAAVQAAAQVNGNDPRLGFYRGISKVLAGTEQARAEQYLKAYLAGTPDRSDWPTHAQAREWLGRLYESEGKRSEAAEQYRAALQLDPSRKQARVRLEQLEKSSR
jgi:tetratricopeptide (TPR) repeat protein